MTKKNISSRLPEFTLTQMEQLKDFYEADDPTMGRFSTARIIIICVNFFWNHIFVEEHPLTNLSKEILNKKAY